MSLSWVSNFWSFPIPLLLLVLNSGCFARTKVQRSVAASQGSVHSMYAFLVRVNSTWVDQVSLCCAGNIVTNRIILTACQCITRQVQNELRRPEKTRIRAGTGDLSRHGRKEEYRMVVRYAAHPDCKYSQNEAFWINDVALLMMGIPLVYNKEIKPLRVYSNDVRHAMDKLKQLMEQKVECSSPGWGIVSFHGGHKLTTVKSLTMRFVQLELCSQKLCQKEGNFCFDFTKYGEILLCADSTMGSPCQGDAGVPLVCEGFLFGMVGTIKHCDSAVPHVYTGISPILDMVNWKFDDGPHEAKAGIPARVEGTGNTSMTGK